jgi:hypothetical protein
MMSVRANVVSRGARGAEVETAARSERKRSDLGKKANIVMNVWFALIWNDIWIVV